MTVPARCVVLLVTTWLVLDMAMPFVPGAFQFDPDSCVEIVLSADLSTTVFVSPDDGPSPGDAGVLPSRDRTSMHFHSSALPRTRALRRDVCRRVDHDP